MLDLPERRTGATRALTGPVRVLRAGLLGGLSLLLATGAHTVGGGALPSAGVLAVAAVLLAFVSALVTARRCRLVALAGLLALEQAALHALFGVAAAAQTCGPAVAGAHAGMDPHVVAPCSAGAMAMDVPGWLMTTAHLAATLATAWVLARGESWLWRVVDRVVVAAGLVRRRAQRTRRAGVPRGRRSGSYAGPMWSTAAPRGPPVASVG